MTAIIITAIICVSFIVVYSIDRVTTVIDRKNYYQAKLKKPEAFITKEDKVNGN